MGRFSSPRTSILVPAIHKNRDQIRDLFAAELPEAAPDLSNEPRDLAMTGRDWLRAFTASFPSAPVEELCDLKRSKYRMGGVITEDLEVETIEEAIANVPPDM